MRQNYDRINYKMYYKSTNHTQGQNISFFQNKVKNLNNIMIMIRRRIKKKKKENIYTVIK